LRRFETNEEQFESPVKKALHDELILSQSTLDSLSPLQQKDILLRGAKLVVKSISSSFGPLGQGIPTRDKSGNHLLAKRGFDISTATWSSNPLENRAVDLLTQASRNMLEKVGDGSKIVILLTFGMIEAGIEALKQGCLPRNIIRGMEFAITQTSSYIDKNKFFLKNQEDVANVAATAGKSKSTGLIIADCLDKVGKFGIVTFERGESKDTEIEIIEGIQFDRGYISANFVTKPDVAYWDFEDSRLLLYPKVISSCNEIVPLMEKIAISKKPLLIIAEDVTDTALDTILLNVQKGIIECVAVKIPRFGSRGMDILEDIAIKTGGKIISSTHGLNLSNIGISELGTAEEIIVTNDYTRIIGGGGKESELKSRVNRLDKSLESCKSLFEKEQYQERLAMLIGATAIVRVGGVTYQDIEEKIYGFRSALNSAMTAIAYGAVVGGGLTLLKAKENVSKIMPGIHEEAVGVEAVLKCLVAPIRSLIQNSNLSLDDVMNNIPTTQDSNKGLDVENGTIADLEELGIFDSSAVLKTALDIALSYSKMFFESSSWTDQRHKDVEV
jgi:chaperonin GroEL